MYFDYNVRKKLIWTVWMFSFAFGQVETNSYEVRKIRLENLIFSRVFNFNLPSFLPEIGSFPKNFVFRSYSP